VGSPPDLPAVPRPIYVWSNLVGEPMTTEGNLKFTSFPAASQLHCVTRTDVNCSEVTARNFHVVDEDVYGLNADGVVIACEA
jgi:hypothetical protein